MIAILIFFLVVALLIADAIIFYALGVVTDTMKIIKTLQDKGWTIEPPKEGVE